MRVEAVRATGSSAIHSSSIRLSGQGNCAWHPAIHKTLHCLAADAALRPATLLERLHFDVLYRQAELENSQPEQRAKAEIPNFHAASTTRRLQQHRRPGT